MLNYERFKEALLQRARTSVESGVEIKVIKIPKNNGLILDGMIFVKGGKCGSSYYLLELLV